MVDKLEIYQPVMLKKPTGISYESWYAQINNLWQERANVMRRIKCEYCGQSNNSDTQIQCIGCGAGLPETNRDIPLWSNPSVGVMGYTTTDAFQEEKQAWSIPSLTRDYWFRRRK